MNTIEIYVKSNTNYNKNGDITLDPISCIYKDSENLITLEHFQDEEGRWKYIEYENVIAIEENEKKILYRIYNVVRSLYKVIAYARPIFYDLVDKVLLDVRPTNKLGQEAINIILAGTGFTGHSNLTTLSTSYYIRKNIVEALIGDMDNSFINRWGGEFYCENYDIYINDRIGSDNGVRVEFGYNLNEIEEDINIENVVTRIIPVGFNGIMLEGNFPWVDSPLINKYTQIKMRVIEFSDVKVKENSNDEEGFNNIEEARAELIRRCNKLYEGGIDKPTVNYKIDMINIANTTAYEGLEMLVDVKKGDTVTCYIPHLDIDVKARVVDFEEDKITGEYISIELGNEVSNFFKDQADVLSIVKKITNDNGSVKANEIQGVINAIQTQFKALRDIAQPQDVRAIIFEDRVENSPTFGCMVLGTMGFEIASKFKPGTQEWDFRTFGTGQGFMADCIIAGILMSRNGVSWINLDNGTFDYANGNLSYDGLTMQIIGKIINVLNGYGVEMDQGGLMFATNGEVVGG
ncbi:phage tail spike protein, partial [Clostridium sp.]|uniref:phage tail spike protein n=1 Tax=Clostridium sp. TaxID=1506 RepID=UPI0025BA9A3C